MSAEAAPRTAKKKRTRWAIIALVVVAVAALAIAGPMIASGGKSSAPTVETLTVSTGTLVVTASADGETAPHETYDVYPAVSGTVDKLEVSVGDKVKAGDLLFTIDDASLQSAVRQANSGLSQAKSQVAGANQQVAQANMQLLQAKNALHTLESLPASRSASSAQIAEAKRGITVAKAGVTSANSSLSSAKVARSNAERSLADARADLDKTSVTAPSDGVVTAVSIASGGSVSTGGGASGASTGADSAAGSSAGMSASVASVGGSSSSAPVVISDTTALIARVAVNEVDIADIAVGQEATMTFDAVRGLEIPAKVSWISPNAVTSGNIRTYDIELTFAEQDSQLRSGMTASADIVTVTIKDALMVPKTAVRVDGTAKFVTVVKPDGSQVKRTVTTGRSDSTSAQILTGLKSDEKVTTSFTAPAQKSRGGLMPPRPSGGIGGN